MARFGLRLREKSSDKSSIAWDPIRIPCRWLCFETAKKKGTNSRKDAPISLFTQSLSRGCRAFHKTRAFEALEQMGSGQVCFFKVKDPHKTIWKRKTYGPLRPTTQTGGLVIELRGEEHPRIDHLPKARSLPPRTSIGRLVAKAPRGPLPAPGSAKTSGVGDNVRSHILGRDGPEGRDDGAEDSRKMKTRE